jgi:hypothetical protein
MGELLCLATFTGTHLIKDARDAIILILSLITTLLFWYIARHIWQGGLWGQKEKMAFQEQLRAAEERLKGYLKSKSQERHREDEEWKDEYDNQSRKAQNESRERLIRLHLKSKERLIVEREEVREDLRKAKLEAEGELRQARDELNQAKLKAEGELRQARDELNQAKLKAEEQLRQVQDKLHQMKLKSEGQLRQARDELDRVKLEAEVQLRQTQHKYLDEISIAKSEHDMRIYEVKHRDDERLRRAMDQLAIMKAALAGGKCPSYDSVVASSNAQETKEEEYGGQAVEKLNCFEHARDQARKELGIVIDRSYMLYCWLLYRDTLLEVDGRHEIKEFNDLKALAVEVGQHLDGLI